MIIIIYIKFNITFRYLFFNFSKRFKASGTDSIRRYRRRILPLRDLEVNTLNSCGLTQQIQQVELSNSSSNTPNSAVTNIMKLK